MMKKMTWGLVVGGMLIFQPSVYAQTLKETVDQTIQTSPDVMIDVNRRLSLDKTVDQARGGYYPKVDVGAGIGREWSENTSTRPGSDTLTRRESGLTLSQMLYDGYAVKSEVERNEARVAAAASQVGDTSERTGLRAVEVYLDVLRSQELLALTQENLAAHERTYEQIRLRTDSGVARKADIEQAQARLSLAQANLASADANLREAKIAFQRVSGSVPQNLETAAGVNCDLFLVNVDETIQAAFSGHPALQGAIANYEAALANERAADAPFKPRVDLELGASANDNLDGVDYRNNDAYAMVRMKYNLYRGGADQSRVRETRFLNQEALAVVDRTKRQIEESTRLSWNALDTARDRLPRLKAHADATALTRDAYAKQFSIGQRTLLDLLDSENELYTARSNYINGQYEERFAQYRMMADMGKLLETLGVARREEASLAGNPTLRSSPESP
jgi:adhesin transport system outer membrane protein